MTRKHYYAIAVSAVIVVLTISLILWINARSRDRAIAELAKNPVGLMQAADSGLITEQQRDKAMEQQAHDMMSKQIDGYFALPEGQERKAYLDKLIDQQEQVRKMVGPVEAISDTKSPGTQPSSGSGGSPNKIVIRKKSGGGDSLPPELRAKVAEFAAAMAKRRAERGLPEGPAGMGGMVVIQTSSHVITK